MRKPRPKDYLVARGLLDGKNATEACTRAGYSPSTVHSKSGQIAKSDRVKQAYLELAATIKPGEIGNIARARLQEELLNLPEAARDRISTIRLGLEADNVIGREQLHLHQHTLPPSVIAILERQLSRLNERVIDAQVVPQGPESPE